jgi:DNA topoisomerase-1
MAKNLVIVESPAKAKTIENYLGKDFQVLSSYGHVRDLPKGDNAIDIANGYEPTYEVSADKKEVIAKLKKIAKEAELIYLASDDDREGEAIAWHLKESLGLNDEKTRRIVFREITKNAILKAIDNPRGIDVDLVNAQQARRVLDRLVGYELSPVLWKKIRTGLSAGRVQSVAVRLVVEREREIDKFNTESAYKVKAYFKLKGGKTLEAERPEKFDKEEEALAFLDICKAAMFTIAKLETKPGKRTPAAPFTTSTLQQEASRKLGFSVSQTMTLAQRLYEAGKITYMRTDSLSLSEEAIHNAKSEIIKEYGEAYSKERRFKTKAQGAQEAHEAIRPTDFSQKNAGGERNEQRLYELIWKRTIASQMEEAVLEKTTATITISTAKNERLLAKGEVIKFDGFLKVYIESSDDEDEEEQSGMLPPLFEGEELSLREMQAKQTFTRPPARYTEASLVKKLEEMGIGRPSTYAPTISTVQKRGYILKENREGVARKYMVHTLLDNQVLSKEESEITGAEKQKLFPTNIAMVVNDFLVDHFPTVIDFNFTASVEKEFDDIAHGQKEWRTMIDNFYQGFHQKIEATEEIKRSDLSSSREIGKDAKTGHTVIARLGKYGPIVQLGSNEEVEKPQFASLRKGQFIDTITMEEAMDLFKLPREVGEFEDKIITAAIGRFGPYLRHASSFYSLPKEDDPYTVDLERSIAIIKAKREAEANKIIKQFEDNKEVQVLNGRYGPYIKVGKQNVKIPKDKDPVTLTLEECLKLAEEQPAKKGKGRAPAKKKK